jgi:light-regulated signal transduction histidine kinase (bacteriophytochrome)
MFDVVTQHFCDPVHHFKHSLEDLLQEIRLFADDFFRDNTRKGQDALQPVQKTRRNMVVLDLLIQELKGQASLSAADTQVASTNLERNVGNMEEGLCDWIQLQGVNAMLVSTLKNRPLRIQPHV